MLKEFESRPIRSGIFISTIDVLISEHLKLLYYGRVQIDFPFGKKLHHTKLLICNSQYAHLASRGQVVVYPFDMDIGIFATGAMAQVDAKLEHSKAIAYQVVPKLGVLFSVGRGLCREIKKYKYPHNSI